MNPLRNMVMNTMKNKINFNQIKNDTKSYSKVLFSTYVFYYLFNSKLYLFYNQQISVVNLHTVSVPK